MSGKENSGNTVFKMFIVKYTLGKKYSDIIAIIMLIVAATFVKYFGRDSHENGAAPDDDGPKQNVFFFRHLLKRDFEMIF